MKSTTNGDSEVGQPFRECLAHDGLADPRGAWVGQDRPLTIRTAGVSLTYGRRAPARPAYVVTARTCDKSTTRQRGRPAV